jgi:hypothetical protein
MSRISFCAGAVGREGGFGGRGEWRARSAAASGGGGRRSCGRATRLHAVRVERHRGDVLRRGGPVAGGGAPGARRAGEGNAASKVGGRVPERARTCSSARPYARENTCERLIMRGAVGVARRTPLTRTSAFPDLARAPSRARWESESIRISAPCSDPATPTSPLRTQAPDHIALALAPARSRPLHLPGCSPRRRPRRALAPPQCPPHRPQRARRPPPPARSVWPRRRRRSPRRCALPPPPPPRCSSPSRCRSPRPRCGTASRPRATRARSARRARPAGARRSPRTLGARRRRPRPPRPPPRRSSASRPSRRWARPPATRARPRTSPRG